MRQSDIISTLMILSSKKIVSREYLAERFSVSERTVSRYLAVLQDAGVPIVSVPGRGGGVKLDEDYVIDKTFLSQAEKLRLKDALLITEGSYGDKVNRALAEKLDAVDRPRESDDGVIKQDDLYIDCEYERAAGLRRKIDVLVPAIDERRAVDISYTDSHGFISFRTVEPYTLVFKEGSWYLYALCRLRGDFRLFKLSRIAELRKTSKRFVRVESKLIEKLELEYYNEVYVDLEIEFFPAVAESIADWLGADRMSERGTKLVASAEVPLTDSLVKRLLGYGSSVKVIGPPELVETMRDEAKRLFDLYSE